MTADGLKGIDLMNPDPIVRYKAENLAMSQNLFNNGYVTPRIFKYYDQFPQPTQDQCISDMYSLIERMRKMYDTGVRCDLNLSNLFQRDNFMLLTSNN